ncbi:oxygenase MpaB family protein [Mycetocola miduiensis]|uniref:oxygenase MpaB family protein n=1 Tax=Mycetocola miduiensis TaxID=995034 RepID=UPI0015A5A6DE|nr:oxygenase MpaB family protein [Mycetocola miduiensis]
MRTLQDIGGDAVLVAGGGRAILLQIANPAVGAGVAAHSDFTSRPLDRLHGTLGFCYAQVYGTDADRKAIARRVNAAHAPVTKPPNAHSAGYSAFDPTLQLWVAATLYDTAAQVHELVFGPLSKKDADEVYSGYAVLGTALQMPADLWPEDRAAFRSWFDAELDNLEVSPEALSVSRQLLTLAGAPLWLRAGLPAVRLVTAALLPPRLREAFGFRWTPRQQRRFDRMLGVVRVVWPAVPRSIRHFPVRYYLRRLRR